MNFFLQTFRSGWTWMRWLRLGLGALLLIQAFSNRDGFSGGLGVLLLIQAFIGCSPCEGGACNLPAKPREEA